jgi:small nuclear ribonucleoprotein (snRNP)-like protein
MLKKIVTIVLIGLVMNLAVFAETKEDKALKRAEKVKANVTKLGTGKDARVEVKLKDGTKLKGYISEINENGFVVMNEKTGIATTVAYPQTKQVKGNNLSTGVKIAIGVGIFLVVVFLIGAYGGD